MDEQQKNTSGECSDAGRGKSRITVEMIDQAIADLYRYQSVMDAYSSIPRSYGPGFQMTEVEAHTLGYIEKEEGMTSKRLCEITNRSKSTISHVVKFLEEQELIYKRQNPDNKREYYLYLTEKGKLFSDQHRAYDRLTTYRIIEELKKTCSEDEITAFLKVMNCRTEIFLDTLKEVKR
ncbi:MAG: winged helix DNA-binding protein [Eubacterium sp.]|nr:winged helix DNA-binding protein [Eubacterium sp.]